MANGDAPPSYITDSEKSWLRKLADQLEGKVKSGATGLLQDVPMALLDIPSTLAKKVAADPGRAMLAVAAQDNPVAERQLEIQDATRAQREAQQAAFRNVAQFAMMQGRSPQEAAALAQLPPQVLGKALFPPMQKPLVAQPGSMVFNPQTGQWETIGTPKLPTSDLAAEEWLRLNPDDPRASMLRDALNASRQAKVQGVTDTTKARNEAKKSGTTVGDTGKPWIFRNGPLRGQPIPSDVTVGTAEQFGTKLTPAEAKNLDGVDALEHWMGELGIQPDGTLKPGTQEMFERQYAKTPNALATGYAAFKRGKRYYGGDPETKNLYQAISVLTTLFAKAQAGTLRVNQTELQLIKEAHPEWTDTAQSAIEKLQRVARFGKVIQDRIIGGLPAPAESEQPFSQPTRLPGRVPTSGLDLSPDEASVFGGP